MLILARNKGESILIFLPDGRKIEVVYLGNTGPLKARIGVDAPEDVRILRRELLGEDDA